MSSHSNAHAVSTKQLSNSNAAVQNGLNELHNSHNNNAESLLLLSTYKQVANVVPGPDYGKITDLSVFEQCVACLESHELPVEMMNDASPFKTFDVVKRINIVRHVINDPALAKRCRNLLVKWKNAIQSHNSSKIAASDNNAPSNNAVVVNGSAVSHATTSTGAAATSPPAPLMNGDYRVAPSSVPAEPVRAALTFKIKIKPVVQNSATSISVPSNAVNAVDAEKVAVDDYISRKRPAPADDDSEGDAKRSVKIKLEDAVPSATTSVAVEQQPVISKKRKSVRIKRVRRKRRIDLSDDESDSNEAVDDIIDVKPKIQDDFTALRENLVRMLDALPPISVEIQRTLSSDFNSFYAEQESRAAEFRQQQQLRLAAEQAAAAAAERDTADDNIKSLLSSPYSADMPSNSNAVIKNYHIFPQADDDDADEDDFDFGGGPSVAVVTEPSSSTRAQKGAVDDDAVLQQQQLAIESSSSKETSVAFTEISPIKDAFEAEPQSSYSPMATDTALRSSPPPPALAQQPTSSKAIDAEQQKGADIIQHQQQQQVVETAVVVVDPQFLDRLHTQNISGCNGHYDAASGAWHNATDSYVARRSDGKRVSVAAYAVID